MKKRNLDYVDKFRDTIKMDDFITFYLNDGNFIECKNLTHKELKMFDIPYVISVSYDFADANKELVLNGKIILVRDKHGNVAPYINPMELRKIGSLDNINEQIIDLRKLKVKYMAKAVSIWNDLQILLHQHHEIMHTIAILEEINKQSSIEQLGGKSYVKKHQGR